MARAVTCPICWGKGELLQEGSTVLTKTCHGCVGRGWVEVSD